MEKITEVLCDFAFSLQYNTLSKITVEQTKKFIADYFAASLAGYKINSIFNSAVLKVVQSLGGESQSSILFEKKKYPAPTAAFVNAVYAHGADLDDGNRLSAGHIGAHVISSVFALAEARNLLWKDVIVAINVGYEFFNRLGSMVQPSLYNKGFHSTGVVGAVASGAACAKLLGLDKKAIYNSVSIASIQASGLIIIDESGQCCKPINPANAARIGVLSALLAEQGIEGPLNPLESKKGWVHAFSDEVKEEYILEELGNVFTINESYLKLYPTCRHSHSCIEAAIELRKELLNIEDYKSGMIKEIQVFTYPSAIRSAGTIIIPNDNQAAKFSIPYAIAVALFKGNFELEDINPDKMHSEIKRLAKLVSFIPDATMENRENGIRGAKIKIVLLNGTSLEKTILTPKGEGRDSLTWEMVEKKMLSCAQSLAEQSSVLNMFHLCKEIDADATFFYFASNLL